MATHSPQHSNNVEAAQTQEHNKRVSFGAEEHVQMIVYDDGINDDYSIGQNNRQLQTPTSRHTYTEPDAPPSRVRVHAEQSELPRPISPPAQIAALPMDAAVAHSSTAGTASNSSIAPSAPALHMNSPPLPSFTKRDEQTSENPFRPDEQLYHEVDPIVEMYRQRPFPPSPTQGSPVPPHQQQQFSRSSSTPNRGEMANGGGGGRNSSLAEARRDVYNQQTGVGQQQQSLLSSSGDGADGVGPPGKVEVVRLPEKKKRACCSLQ